MERAYYTEQDMEEFIGNPLIQALPPPLDLEDIPKNLIVIPPYSEELRNAAAHKRLSELQRLAQLHVPTKEDTMLLLNISRCLTWSYAGRNPMDFEFVKKCLNQKGIEVTPALKRYLERILAPIYGFPVLGISGVGKTTSVMNALSLYPQVIQHTSFYGCPFEKKQLVWLKVDCPADGTEKGLCSAILHRIDEALGTDYSQTILRNRMSKDVLLVKVSQLVQSLYLGILVIDDIQSLCTAKNTVSKQLLRFMVSLSNNLKIPVVMVGTPKILQLLQEEFEQAKRSSGEGEIRMNLMAKNSFEWNRFMKMLWPYQYLKNTVELTPEIDSAFYDMSVGNPFVVATLYKIVQDDAIISKQETFSAQDIVRISNTKMGMTAQMRRNMLNNIDVELNAFRSLWNTPTPVEPITVSESGKPNDTYGRLVGEVSGILIGKHGLSAPDARRIARATIAANPNETDSERLVAYALDIVNEKESPHDG